jgi:MoxR-like ATPase
LRSENLQEREIMNNVVNFTDCGGNTVSIDAVKFSQFKEKMNGSTFNRTTALEVGKEVGLTKRAIRFGVLVDNNRIGVGTYSMKGISVNQNGNKEYQKPKIAKETTETVVPVKRPTPEIVDLVAKSMNESLIPDKFEGFVEWGHYKDVTRIIKSDIFYPIFITGLSGNGKTLMIEQAHAKLQKEMVRVNVTIETDEDDLLGGFRLVNGETKFVPGPVVEAMEKGATLLLDEVDLGSNKLLCLQPVLEGKGVYLKKVNKWVRPTAGFNVIATANTKGKGSEDGRFIGTNVLNEAFLERFAICLEQPYADTKIEFKIVRGAMIQEGVDDEGFAKKLVDWADVIRKTFYDDAIDEVISTRRLVHIVKAFSIFKDKLKAINLCVARFDNETKDAFLDLYTKIDAGVSLDNETNEEASATPEGESNGESSED